MRFICPVRAGRSWTIGIGQSVNCDRACKTDWGSGKGQSSDVSASRSNSTGLAAFDTRSRLELAMDDHSAETEARGILSAVPLFPLPNVVLFPRALLPLHIFEERYKAMTADALAGDKQIAMALLKPGWEKNYYCRPAIE